MKEYKGAVKQLKMVLLDKEISQAEFARMVEMPKQSLYNMFNRNSMGYKQVEEFADILGCDIVFKDRETGKEY